MSPGVWDEFDQVFWLQFRVISDIVLKEKGQEKVKHAIKIIESLIEDMEKTRYQGAKAAA